MSHKETWFDIGDEAGTHSGPNDFLEDEWMEAYTRFHGRAIYSLYAMDAARQAAHEGYADDLTVLNALCRAARLVESCVDQGAMISNRWAAVTIRRSYHMRAAVLLLDAELPFNRDERAFLRDQYFVARGDQPLVDSPQLTTFLERGRIWLAEPDSIEVSDGYVVTSSCYNFDWAQNVMWRGSHDSLFDSNSDDFLDVWSPLDQL